MAEPLGLPRVVGIIGDPVAHSLSPRMHTAAFEALGLNWRYLAFRVARADLARAVRGLVALGFAGVNVTVPHKEAVVPLLDEVDAAAAPVGAVNTIRIDGGRLRGFNTDGDGLLDALTRAGGAAPKDRRCLVLGAGGGAKAAAFALARAGAAQIVVLNRTPARAEDLATRLAAHAPGLDVESGALDAGSAARAARNCDIIVQATTATMSAAFGGAGGQAPWLGAVIGSLRSGMAVCDMVYTPRWTALLTAAKAAGAAAVSGLSMLVYQGARAFELWTGTTAPVDVMTRAVDAEISYRG